MGVLTGPGFPDCTLGTEVGVGATRGIVKIFIGFIMLKTFSTFLKNNENLNACEFSATACVVILENNDFENGFAKKVIELVIDLNAERTLDESSLIEKDCEINLAKCDKLFVRVFIENA